MKIRQGLIKELENWLVNGQWLSIYGPIGIGKGYIADELANSIEQQYERHYLVLNINFKQLHASSRNDLEDKLVMLLIQKLSGDVFQCIDFIDGLEKLADKTQKKIILIITELDHGVREGSDYLAQRLGQLYHQQESDNSITVTTMISSDTGTDRLVFKDTSPFRACKPIEIMEWTEQETDAFLRYKCPELTEIERSYIYQQTLGFCGLIEALITFMSGPLYEYKSITIVITDFVKDAIDETNRLKLSLVRRWFKRIKQPWIVDVIEKLNNKQVVKLKDMQCNHSEICTYNFFRLVGDYIKYRNQLIKSIVESYATPLNIADHYWIFAAGFSGYWKKGLNLYLDRKQITEQQNERVSKKIIGPNNLTLGEFIYSCCRYLDKKESTKEVHEVMDNILHCIFNIQNYCLIKLDQLGDSYEVVFQPEIVDGGWDNTSLKTLIKKVVETKQGWVSIWGHEWMAFPFNEVDDEKYLLVVDNGLRRLKKEYNWSIAALVSRVGQSLLRVKRKNEADILKSVFIHAQDDVRVFDHRGQLKNCNLAAQQNCENLLPGDNSLLSRQKLLAIQKKNSSGIDSFSSEIWQSKQKNAGDSIEIIPGYMEVSAFNYGKKGSKNNGVIAITRDVTLQHRLLSRVMKFPSAKTGKEVYDLLLTGLIEQRAKRVRVFIPDKGGLLNNCDDLRMISKYCIGYEDEPEVEQKLRTGKFDSDRVEDILKSLKWEADVKPNICRIDNDLNDPISEIKSDSPFHICSMPEAFDAYREQLKKKQTNEWLHIGLFSEHYVFAMLSIDKGNNGEPFKAVECNRMETVCRAAEMALVRIAALDIANIVRMFRHSVAQQLTAISQFMWVVAESDLPQAERLAFAEEVDELLQRFEAFNRTMVQLMPENNEQMSINLQTINITESLNKAALLFKYYCQKAGIEFKVDSAVSPGLCLHTNDILLHTILFNLLENAFKSVAQTSGEKKVTLQCRTTEQSLIFSVTDNGKGVSVDASKEIFKMGFSGSKNGSGIGLPTCKLMAQKLQAEIELDNKYTEEGVGAKFNLIFLL